VLCKLQLLKNGFQLYICFNAKRCFESARDLSAFSYIAATMLITLFGKFIRYFRWSFVYRNTLRW